VDGFEFSYAISLKSPLVWRLVFAELEGLPAGRRVFDVVAGDETVLKDFDPAAEAGGRAAELVREFELVADEGFLEIKLVSKGGDTTPGPLLCGVEVVPVSIDVDQNPKAE
jgi:hypothetical protein